MHPMKTELQRTYIPKETYDTAKEEARVRGRMLSPFLAEAIQLGIKVMKKKEEAGETVDLEAIA